MELRTAFAYTLRELRQKQGLTQEDFTGISSRTNLSLLEREKTIPTIEKLDQLCSVLEVHPITLMALCYAKKEGRTVAELVKRISNETCLLTIED